jgi:hypothetical protein
MGGVLADPVGLPFGTTRPWRNVLDYDRRIPRRNDRDPVYIPLERPRRDAGNPSCTDRDQTVFVDPRFLESFSIEGVDPPQKATARADGLIGYVFGSDPSGPAKIVFRLQTQEPGPRSFLLGIDRGVAEHSTFILP